MRPSKGLLIGGLVALAVALAAGGFVLANAGDSAGAAHHPVPVVPLSGSGTMGQGYGMMGQGYGQSSLQQTTPAPSAKPDRTIKLVIKSDAEHGKRGPDGQWHDAFLAAGFSVRAGETVAVEVSNHDDMPHSFTAPSLGLNVDIPGGSASAPVTTTFTFTAPSGPGRYAWWCAAPCDPFSMAHDGFMRGSVTVG